MWITKIFRREKPEYTLADLAAALKEAPGFQYDVLVSEHTVSLRCDNQIVAFIEVTNGEATVFYDFSVEPYMAGEIALVVNDHLPAFVSGCYFTARRVDDALGVH